jgi:hypothetical protein
MGQARAAAVARPATLAADAVELAARRVEAALAARPAPADRSAGGGATGGATGGTGGATGGTGGAAGTGGAGGATGGTGGATGGTGGAAGRGGTGGAAGTGGAGGTGGATGGTGGAVGGTGGATGGTGGARWWHGRRSRRHGRRGPAALHLYVGCADSTGTIQSYAMNGTTGALTPLGTFVAGGAISNCEFNDAEDRLYLAHVIGTENRITTYTRSVTTGALTPLGTPAVVPFTPPATGGAGGAGGAGGTGGAATTNANTQTLTFDRDRHFLVAPELQRRQRLRVQHGDRRIGRCAGLLTRGRQQRAPRGLHAQQQFRDGPVPGLEPDQRLRLQRRHRRADSVEHRRAAGHDRAAPHCPAPERDVAVFDQRDLRGRGVGDGLDRSVQRQPDHRRGGVRRDDQRPAAHRLHRRQERRRDRHCAPPATLLFVSMRLDNVAMGSLVSYMVNPTTGALTLIEQESSRGAQPRHFSLSKDRRLLVVGNQASNTIAVFSVDPAGAMTFIADRDVCLSPRFARMAIDQ